MDWYDVIGDVTLRIDSKYPCDINNVSFSITANGGAATGMLVGKEQKLSFKGTMPQSGSYSSTKNVKIDVGGLGPVYDGLKYNEYDIEIRQAAGTISLKNVGATSSNNPDLVADELIKLAELLDKGLLTQEEYDAQKAKLLGY